MSRWPYLDPLSVKTIRPFGDFEGGLASIGQQTIFSHRIANRLIGVIFSVYGRPYQAFTWILKINGDVWHERGIIDWTASSMDPSIDAWLPNWTDRMIQIKDGDLFELVLDSSESGVGYAYHVAGYEYEP